MFDAKKHPRRLFREGALLVLLYWVKPILLAALPAIEDSLVAIGTNSDDGRLYARNLFKILNVALRICGQVFELLAIGDIDALPARELFG